MTISQKITADHSVGMLSLLVSIPFYGCDAVRYKTQKSSIPYLLTTLIVLGKTVPTICF